MGKKNKKEALRTYQLKRRATLEQRRALFYQINENVYGISQEVHYHIAAPKTKVAKREMLRYKESQGIVLNQTEHKMLHRRVEAADFEFVNPTYDFSEPEASDVQLYHFTGDEAVKEQVYLVNAHLQQDYTEKVDGLAYEAKPDKSAQEQKGFAEYYGEPDESASEDAIAVISDFAEKRFVLRGAPAPSRQAFTSLPISEKRFEFLEVLRNTDLLILRAPTGTGKSTQLPQFLLSDGYGYYRPGFLGRILCTQPRRIAAVGLASRVSEEWGEPNVISHAVRGDSTFGARTRVLYATEGVLLYMLKSDALLREFSVIILDEAHERSQQMDVAVALLARISARRRAIFEAAAADVTAREMSRSEFDAKFPVQPLKLIVMSATLQADQFAHVANSGNAGRALRISVNARAFPVAVHYEKEMCINPVGAAAEKALKIHREYPPGAILIFVTGAAEVQRVCALIEQELGGGPPLKREAFESSESEGFYIAAYTVENERLETDARQTETYTEEQLLAFEHTSYQAPEDKELVEYLKEEVKQATEQKDNNGKPSTKPPRHLVLPLYSALPLDQQRRIYAENDRKTTRVFIVATNIAESSITVPNVRYVVDSCMQKVRVYRLQVYQLVEQYTAIDNLVQRAGRAGRTQPGHCFRLVTPGQFGTLAKSMQPELYRLDLGQILMYLLRIGINPMNFAWPQDFDTTKVAKYLNDLCQLGAVRKVDKRPRLTGFGLRMANVPLDVHAAAICCFGKSVLAVAVAAALQTGCFIGAYLHGTEGDFLAGGRLLLEFVRTKRSEQAELCQTHGLNYDKIRDSAQVFRYLCGILSYAEPHETPDASDVQTARQAVLFTFLPRYAILENEKFERYQIPQMDLRQHYSGHATGVLELLEESPYVSSALLDRDCACKGAKARFVVYQAVDLRMEYREDKLSVSCVLKCAQPFALGDLLVFADLSEVLSVSLPKSVFLDAKKRLRCRVDVFLDQLELGETEVAYPGRRAREFLDCAKLEPQAKIMLLARGDYGVKIQCSFEVREQFSKGVFESACLERAAQLLVGCKNEFWRDAELVHRIEQMLCD